VRSQEEITHFAASWLDKRYGDRVSVEFQDVGKPGVAASLGSLSAAAGSRQMSLPIVTVGGQIARIQWFSAWGLIDAVEEYMNATKADGAAG
jgi:hypothetical protein